MRLTVVALACALAGCASGPGPLPAVEVQALRETEPVGTAKEDAADDPAIWRNAADPSASLVVGTDKKAGLYVYGLDGKVRDFLAAGALNNVDLREIVGPGGQAMILVAASDRTDLARPHIALFALDGASGKLTGLGKLPVFPANRTAPAEAYGFCMGPARDPGEVARAYVVMKDGEVTESRLTVGAAGLEAAYLRSIRVATQAEGCVVDEATGTLYLGEENAGIWAFALGEEQPAPRRFAAIGAEHGLVADVEGLAIARDETRAWLIASSQGDNAFALFDLAEGNLIGRFRITDGTVDGTSETDGIEVSLGDFGPGFESGMFVAQDGDNAPEAQNFKLVPWQDVVRAVAGIEK